MKSIVITIKPFYACAIYSGSKPIEVRKNKALANAVKKLIAKYGKAQIYVAISKDSNGKNDNNVLFRTFCYGVAKHITDSRGKIAFGFICKNVYTYEIQNKNTWNDKSFEKITKDLMFLSLEELHKYVGDNVFYGLEVSTRIHFEKPRELSEFWNGYDLYDGGTTLKHRLTKAPQNYCYIESVEVK